MRSSAISMKTQTKILAFDNSQLDEPSEGTAYYRIDPHFRDFLTKCIEKHAIVGFTYEKGELNFGVILGTSLPKENEQEGVGK